MESSLLNIENLPMFSTIKIEDIVPTIDFVLQQNRNTLKKLLQQDHFTWDNLLKPFEAMENKLTCVWSPVEHLYGVKNNDELRKAYNHCLPKLSDYGTEISQNEELYQAIKQIYQSDAYKCLDFAKQKTITDMLRDFRLVGAGLPQDKKQKIAKINQQLATLTANFEENLLDATDHWFKQVDDRDLLSGLPSHAIDNAANEAKKRDQSGWILTLAFPCYYAVITFADNRQLREEFYRAYVTRASDQGDPQQDNTEVMNKLVILRHELATLLGFASYTEYSIATKMVTSTQQVFDFIDELVAHSLPVAKKEFAQLCDFAKTHHNIDELQPWDMSYFSEKLQQHQYAISEEALRPYFPDHIVLTGLFELVKQLYGINISEVVDFDSWHEDVRLFAIYNKAGDLQGQFYLDLFARAKKRSGAWMFDSRQRYLREDGTLQTPVAYIVCNFPPAVDDKTPALLSHDEVLTLFHEVGHGLHHMLTKIDTFSVSGIQGVPWDAVELPSQFMENFCWEKSVLSMIAQHYETKQPLPDDLYEKMQNARHFQTGMQMLRQLEFSLFDFRLYHALASEKTVNIQAILDEVRCQVSVVPVADFNRFAHGFSHIFSGGYAAGYYSYKWAEVLSSDAYGKFESAGIFDQETAQSFLENILEMGGAKEFMDLFVAFRGREPTIDALLRHSGISINDPLVSPNT